MAHIEVLTTTGGRRLFLFASAFVGGSLRPQHALARVFDLRLTPRVWMGSGCRGGTLQPVFPATGDASGYV